MFPRFHACPKDARGNVGGSLTLPQSLSIVIGWNTQWKEWLKCISEVITEKCHWFSRYKHLAVKINKLLHPYNDCLPKQMLLKWLPAPRECCDDASKWCFLLFQPDREPSVFSCMISWQCPPCFPVGVWRPFPSRLTRPCWFSAEMGLCISRHLSIQQDPFSFVCQPIAAYRRCNIWLEQLPEEEAHVLSLQARNKCV